MADIDMFGSRRNGVRFCNNAGTLVVAEDGEGMGSGKAGKSKKKFEPNSLLNGVGQGIILRLRRRRGHNPLFSGQPRNKGVKKEEAVARYTFPVLLIRSPISIREAMSRGEGEKVVLRRRRRRRWWTMGGELEAQGNRSSKIPKNAFSTD